MSTVRGKQAAQNVLFSLALITSVLLGRPSMVVGFGEPPPNDDCPNAFDVGPLPAVVLGDTTDGLSDIFFSCGFSVDGPFRNVWYTVTGTGGTLTATTCSDNTEIPDTEISVFCGDCEEQICVDGNDDDCPFSNPSLSTVSWCSEAGRTYFITVGGAEFGTATGLFELTVTDAGDLCDFPIECEVLTGACCSLGTCKETTIEKACDGQFFPGETCPEFDCPSECFCDDGIFCNGVETCDEFGGCIPGTAVDCSHLDNECSVGVCDDDIDECVSITNDELCDDGEFCNGVEICDPMQGCVAGTSVDCSHLDTECNVGICDEDLDECVSIPDDELCDDGQFCNGVETCDPMEGCVAGTPVDCSHLDDVCVIGACDEDADACVAQNVDDEPCDDGLFCTEGTTCDGGVCTGGSPLDCDDGIPCTDDVCNEDTDMCEHVPNDPLCNDGNPCTDGVCEAVVGCVFEDNGACGACCDASPGLGGACSDGVVAGACAGPNQAFYPGEACENVFCAEVTGACCDGETGDCVVTTVSECNCSLCIWSQGETCEDVSCEPSFSAIPAVSEWGMVVLVLLFLTAMKLRFARTEAYPSA